MLQLPNNCRAGKFTVFPKNWNSVKANPSLTWKFYYWFYDDNLKQRKKIVIKGMNTLSGLRAKQEAIKSIEENELDLILKKGFNHITKTFNDIGSSEISEYTPLNFALDYAYKNLNAVKSTMDDIESCLKYFKMAATAAGLADMPVGSIRRKHIKRILNKCGEIKKTWTSNTYNHYRKYISILFKELLDPEAVDHNPLRDLAKKKTIKTIRTTLTQKERKKIDNFLRENHYYRWRFMHIFFHAGGRESEILKIRKSDVDLENQRYKSITLKGRSGREIWRPIKDIALNLWKEAYAEAGPNQFLFAKFMRPGDVPINPHQISRWWRTHIKKPFGITADFYALKHSNTTETMDYLTGITEAAEQAAQMNGHTSTAMVVNIYDIKQQDRKNEVIKKVNNPFV